MSKDAPDPSLNIPPPPRPFGRRAGPAWPMGGWRVLSALRLDGANFPEDRQAWWRGAALAGGISLLTGLGIGDLLSRLADGF